MQAESSNLIAFEAFYVAQAFNLVYFEDGYYIIWPLTSYISRSPHLCYAFNLVYFEAPY